MEKAVNALNKYEVNGVVCNLLHTRREHVQLVTTEGSNAKDRTPCCDTGIRSYNQIIDIYKGKHEEFIETELVQVIKKLHCDYMNKNCCSHCFRYDEVDITKKNQTPNLATILSCIAVLPLLLYLQ